MNSAAKAPDPSTGGQETASALSNMFGRGSLYTVAFASQTLFNIIMTPITTRALGPRQYGVFAAILSVAQVIQVVASLGLHAGVQRHFADEPGDRESRGLVAVGVVVGLTVSALLFATQSLWSGALGYPTNDNALRLGIWWSGLGAIAVTTAALLRAQDRLRAFLIIVGIQGIGGQAIGIMLVLCLRPTATNYFTGLLIGQTLGVLVGLILVRPDVAGLRRWLVSKANLAFSLPLVPHMLAGLVLNAGDRIVVQRDLGEAAVGRYQLA